MRRKKKTPPASASEVYQKLKPIESSTTVAAFVNRVIGKLNAGFSLLLKKDVDLGKAYSWEDRLALAAFYQYMRLRYKIPYYISMAAYVYYWRKRLEANYNPNTYGIGLGIRSMYGDGAEDAILHALSRKRFRHLNHTEEFYNELMRALFTIENVPSLASIKDLETERAFRSRDRALNVITKRRRNHRRAVEALKKELEAAAMAPFNPVMDKESAWYLKSSE